MVLHACKSHKNNLLVVNTSCYCKDCLQGELCGNWSVAAVISGGDNPEQTQVKPNESTEDTITSTIKETENLITTYNENDYVATKYLDNWYVGKILQIDETDNEAEMSFMKQKKNLFQWPSTEDILWVTQDDIICKIKDPKPSGKSARMYRLEREDLAKIEQLYSK